MRIIIVTLVLIVIPHYSMAQESGLKLLNIGPTAFELALSEATVATPNGAPSLYSNPALLSMAETTTLGLGYTNWISDSNNLFGGINLKKNRRAVAFSFYTSGVSGLEQRNGPGESNGDFSIQYVAISGAYSYDFDYFSAGISGHYLNEEIFPFRATGYAVSLGLASELFNDRLTLGASLLNLGEMEELNQIATDLPSSFNAGFAIDLISFTHKKAKELPVSIRMMADYVMPLDTEDQTNVQDYNPDESYINVAALFEVAEVVQIQTGYKTGDNTRPISFGIGLITEKVTFNYALIPFNTGFGTVHSVGLQYQL
ncbi:MAG: hypothetical protein ED557_01670 [Balneola sp.]|nr:MAG: hypothetical protein ED557_01670 [Balneola sp.]